MEGILLNNAEGTVWSVLPNLSKYSHTLTELGEKKTQTVCLCIDMFIPILPERKQHNLPTSQKKKKKK